MERHAHHRQPCHTRVTQRGRPSDPDPIRFQRIQRSGGAIERTIERIVVFDRVHQHHRGERPGGAGEGEGERTGSGSEGRG